MILNIQKKTTRNAVLNFDKQNPTVITAKNNSSRIAVAGYDITPSEEYLYYNERIFNLKKITLEEMVQSYETIDRLVYDFLVMNQQGRGSYFITGSDMGVGKSTFLLAMLEKTPDAWGIGILDNQNELQAKRKYAWKNIITLVETPARTMAECFSYLLKTSRDVMVVSEVTMPAEVSELIHASLRLNAGVGATMHSISPWEVVANLRNLLMRTGIYNNADMAESDIARSLDIVIHLEKLPGGRIVVADIVEVEYMDQERYVEPQLQGTLHDRLLNLVEMAQLALGKYLYRKSYRYNPLFHYNRENNTWQAVNMPSPAYFRKIAKYVEPIQIENFQNDSLVRKEENMHCIRTVGGM